MSNNNKYRRVGLDIIRGTSICNSNADEAGQNKTGMLGGFLRMLFSSQSVKKVFADQLRDREFAGDHGVDAMAITRTRKMSDHVCELIVAAGGDEEAAKNWSVKVADAFSGKKDEKKKGVLALYSDAEVRFLADTFCDQARWTKQKGEIDKSKLLDASLKLPRDPGLTLGRMYAGQARLNINSCFKFAPFVSVNDHLQENGYRTAVDDRDKDAGLSGAGHIDSGVAYASSVMYGCVVFEAEQFFIACNIEDDEEKKKWIRAVLTSFALAYPTGKQNMMYSNTQPSFVMARLCNRHFMYCDAFYKPVRPTVDRDMIEESIVRLKHYHEQTLHSWGDTSPSQTFMFERGDKFTAFVDSVADEYVKG